MSYAHIAEENYNHSRIEDIGHRDRGGLSQILSVSGYSQRRVGGALFGDCWCAISISEKQKEMNENDSSRFGVPEHLGDREDRMEA